MLRKEQLRPRPTGPRARPTRLTLTLAPLFGRAGREKVPVTNGTVDCNVLSFNEKGLVACGIVLRESMN